MDPVMLARIQFALTIGFHYIFPPLTIGLSWRIFWIMTRYWRTGRESYRTLDRVLDLEAMTEDPERGSREE